MIPDGVEPSLPACRAGVVPLDHGIGMTEVGVEPTKSPGSRPGRFANLRTRPNGIEISHARKLPVQVSHLAVEAYEASLGAGPPASIVRSCRPR